MASNNDKMGIKRLDHVCWAVQSVEDVLPLLTELMGMTVEGRFENPEVGFRGVGLRVPGGTGHFELLEPYDENSYLHRFLRERGTGPAPRDVRGRGHRAGRRNDQRVRHRADGRRAAQPRLGGDVHPPEGLRWRALPVLRRGGAARASARGRASQPQPRVRRAEVAE